MFSIFTKKKSRSRQRKSFFQRFQREKRPKRKRASSSRRSEKSKRSNIFKSFLALHGQPNLGVVGIVTFFCVAGLIMIFSASAYYAYSDPNIGDSFFYFKRQLIWLGLGSLLGYIFFLMPLE